VYAKWFGEPDADSLNYYRMSALPD
jgi:hypothetical protein